MKKALIVLLPVIALSCNNKKETASKTNEPTEINHVTKGADNSISFKVNGEQVTTSAWNINRFTMGGQNKEWLNITSNMNQEKRTINVNLDGTVAGTYTIEEGGAVSGKSHGSYHPDFSDAMNAYSFTSGSFVISEIDTVKNIVNGSFSGTARNAKGETVQVTDGKIINAPLKPGITRL